MENIEPSPSPAPRRRGRWLLRLVALAGLFLVGAVASVSYQALVDVAVEPDEAPPPAPVVAKPHKQEPDEAADVTVARAERYVREQNYLAALNLYRELLGAKDQPGAALALRIGQCREMLGDAEGALTAYRQASSQEASALVRGTAQLAEARVLIRQGQPAEAKHLLYALLFRGHDPAAGPDVLAAAHYWLAVALSRAALPNETGEDVAAFVLTARLPADAFAESGAVEPKALPVAKAPAKAAANAPAQDQVLTVPVVPKGKEPVVRRAVFSVVAAPEFFDCLAKSGNRRLDWTPNARATVKDRVLHLELEQWRVVDLLATAADQFELVCQCEGNVVRLATAAEAAPAARAAHQLALARWSMQAACAVRPQHRLAAAAYLQLGNLEAVAGRREDALRWYEQLVRERPNAPEAVSARYNQAMVHARAGAHDPARQALFHAFDLAPAHELAPLVLFQIGRLDVEDGEFVRAVARLRRARALTGPVHQPRIALLLAATLLAAEEPTLAHEALVQARQQLRQDPSSPTAALLDALARHHVARSRGPARAESADLIAALAQPRDPHLLGPIEPYLCCGALADLGLWTEVVATCAKAVPATHGPLQTALQVKQAEALLQLGKHNDAVKLFQQVRRSKSKRWSAAAGYQLAHLELQQGHAKECVQHCAELWNDRTGDEAALLRLWGSAYEQLGDFARAARCYAGSPPE